MGALDPVQTAILNAIPQLTSEDLEAYVTMASSNFLFPQRIDDSGTTRILPRGGGLALPAECNVERRQPDDFGGVPAYSYVIRFTMLRDDDPYEQGIPSGTVGYWTHDGDGCHIDSHHQIHGIKWVGHSSSLAITNEQEWTVDLLLFGANCGWPTNWDALYNGYVNATLNSVVSEPGKIDWDAYLRTTCGEWRTDGYVSSAAQGRYPSWVISNVMWSTVFQKIWNQSLNVQLKPGIARGPHFRLTTAVDDLLRNHQDQIRLRDSSDLRPFDEFASVINRVG